ncbi:MAG: ABC transporter substrate-binding protein [Micropruina sp.]|uniref:ABC transporter substrate-binding protein n=1 Tax=Micropruina sp. TaxID=2737536 RepID=UPI0039E4F6EB
MGDDGSIWDRGLSRRTLGMAALGVAGAGLAGCASGAPAATSASPTASPSATTADFPTTIKHAFGETVVPAQPTKVVSVGVTEHDFLLALGVVPIGVTDWYGDQPYATWPWARAALGSAQPKVLKNYDGFQFLEIAKLKPDLLVGPNAGMEQADYTKLSKIAPTIAHARADAMWFSPWHEMLAMIAQAVGKVTEGEQLTAAVRKKFVDAAAANPSFAGKKAIFLQNAVYDGSLIAYQKGLSTEFLTDLGFEIPSEIDPYIKEGEQTYIPVEKISVLNAADVLVWGTEKDTDRAALEKVPGFTSLAAVKTGRSVYTGGELAGAIYFSSPLSLPYVVDTLVPMLADALKAG